MEKASVGLELCELEEAAYLVLEEDNDDTEGISEPQLLPAQSVTTTVTTVPVDDTVSALERLTLNGETSVKGSLKLPNSSPDPEI